MAHGGYRPGSGRPKKLAITRDMLEKAGAIIATDYESGKQMLLDIVNLRFDRLGVAEIGLNERMKAAIELLPYTDQKMPTKIDAKVDHSWASAVREAEERRRSAEGQAEAVIVEAASADA